MERAELKTVLSGFRGAEASFPFGPEACVYKVRGKMFALLSQDDAPSVTLKCNPEDGELIVGQFNAVKPGYHMNKRHWLTITLSGDVPDTVLRGLAEDSYKLVVEGLPKAVQAELGGSMDVLFVQGAGGYEEDAKLAASLQKALGSSYTVHYPRMPDEDAPDYTAWKAKILEELSAFEGEVVLAGHSLGASLLLKVVVEEAPPVAGLFLVAAPYWGLEDWEADYALPETFASSLPPDLPLHLYGSQDDDVVPVAHLERYAAELPGAVVRMVERGGHQFGDDLTEVARDIQALRGEV